MWFTEKLPDYIRVRIEKPRVQPERVKHHRGPEIVMWGELQAAGWERLDPFFGPQLYTKKGLNYAYTYGQAVTMHLMEKKNVPSSNHARVPRGLGVSFRAWLDATRDALQSFSRR